LIDSYRNNETPNNAETSLETSVLDNAYFRYSTGLDPGADNTFVMPIPEGTIAFYSVRRHRRTHSGDRSDLGVDEIGEEDTGGGPYADGFQGSVVDDDEVYNAALATALCFLGVFILEEGLKR
jgi:hypothetical protein